MKQFDDKRDKKILIKSNGIFITGRDTIRLNSNHVALGRGADDQPVVKGGELKKVLLDLISALEKATFIGVAPGSPTTPAVNVLEFTNLRTKLETILSDKVKTA